MFPRITGAFSPSFPATAVLPKRETILNGKRRTVTTVDYVWTILVLPLTFNDGIGILVSYLVVDVVVAQLH